MTCLRSQVTILKACNDTELADLEFQIPLWQDLDRILGLSNARPAVVEEEVDQFLASGRVSEANLKRLLRRAEARLIIAGARSDAGYSAVTAGSRSQRDPPKPVPAQVPPAAPAPASARMPQRDEGVSAEEQLLKWSQVAKLAHKEAELEALQKREAKKNAQTEIRTYLQQQIDEKNSKKQKAAEAEKKFCHLGKGNRIAAGGSLRFLCP